MNAAWLDAEGDRQTARIAGREERRRLVDVAILSGLGLLVELLLIRWLDVHVRPLDYVRNVPLIASFLGLGIGFTLADSRRNLLPLAAPLLAVAIGFGGAVPATWMAPEDLGRELGFDSSSQFWQLVVFYGSVLMVFVLATLATLPLGQIAGAYMRGAPALGAYTANVSGSLAGILLAFLLSAFSFPPWLNAAIAFGLISVYLATRWLQATSLVIGVICCAGMIASDRNADSTVWTLYNRIELFKVPSIATEAQPEDEDLGWVIAVQGLYFQRLLNLAEKPSDAVAHAYPFYGSAYYAYNQPYAWMPRPRNVLVVGAGTGNDVAAALRHGAERVDAVEIDARILEFGYSLHPERPYQDPRVTRIVDDARSFLVSESDQKYDLIVFGLLDSHISTFSSFASNIRLDNYVYTLEAFEQALERLTPDGVICLSFWVAQPWVPSRIDAMLRQVYDGPIYVTPTYYDDGVLFMLGPGLEPIRDERVTVGLPPEHAEAWPPGPLASDDWPFLYLRERGVPADILWASAVMLLASAIVVRLAFRGGVVFDRQLFFLGSGFLLVETRTIAQLGLLFGSTWQVSGITIAAILAMIIGANMIVAATGRLPSRPLYGALLLCLVAHFFVEPGWVLGSGTLASLAMAVFLVLPLFFAALIFASSVRGRERLAPAMASNLTGSVLGGLLENLSLLIGISGLSLLAALLYVASYRR